MTRSALKKPALAREAVLDFAEAKQGVRQPAMRNKIVQKRRTGFVPEGDVRLTVNVRQDLHLRLRMRALEERTTAGELIEAWIEGWKK